MQARAATRNTRLATTQFKPLRIKMQWLALICIVITGLLAIQISQPLVSYMRSAGWDKELKFTGNDLNFRLRCTINVCGQKLWTATANEGVARVYPAAIAGIGAAMLMLAFMLGNLELDRYGDKRPASGEWATNRDILPLVSKAKDKDASGYIGVSQTGEVMRLTRKNRVLHSVVLGSQGAGKTSGYFKPNIWYDAVQGECAIIIDIKYPDPRSGFFDVVPWFQNTHDVQLFIPYGEHTMHLPLLKGGHTAEGALEIAAYIIGDDDNPAAEYYTASAKVLLGNLIVTELEYGKGSIGAILDIFKGGTDKVVERIMELEVQRRLPGFGTFLDLGKKEKTAILNGLVQRLRLWMNPLLDRATSISDKPGMNIDLSVIGSKPSLIYIGIPQQQLQGDNGELLLRLVYRLISKAIRDNANVFSRETGELPINTNWYLDEFANMGFLRGIAEDFNTMRSFNVALHMGIQNFAGGRAKYTRDGFEAIYTGIGTKIYIPQKVKELDRDEVSKILGQTTVLEASLSRGTSKGNLSSNISNSKNSGRETRPLLAPEEFDNFSLQEVIVKTDGIKPIKAWLPRLDQPKPSGAKILNPLHLAWKKKSKGVNVDLYVKTIIKTRHMEAVKRNAAPLETSIDIQQAAANMAALQQRKNDRRVTKRPFDDMTVERRVSQNRKIENEKNQTQSPTSNGEIDTTTNASNQCWTLVKYDPKIIDVKQKNEESLKSSQLEVSTKLWEKIGKQTDEEVKQGTQPKRDEENAPPNLNSGIKKTDKVETQQRHKTKTEAQRDLEIWIERVTRKGAEINIKDETYLLLLETIEKGHPAPALYPEWVEYELVKLQANNLQINTATIKTMNQELITRLNTLKYVGKAVVYARKNKISVKNNELIIDEIQIIKLYRQPPTDFKRVKTETGYSYRISVEGTDL